MRSLKYVLLSQILLLFWIEVGICASPDTLSNVKRVRHPDIGTTFTSKGIKLTLIEKKQYYNRSEALTIDKDIRSPKSVNIHPSGKKFYVNSLEGGRTVVYHFPSGEKISVISHLIGDEQERLWAPQSGLFPFRHHFDHPNHFCGKPVESVFTHSGRYLWIPYYRRSYDINAQEPSAMAVIDTESDTIVRLFETGALPKMVAVSADGTRLAVTHWGENTVGLLDISSDSPLDWHYVACVIVDHKLNLNFSLKEKVNRDINSGLCLRGTVFTPDGRYLLIGCMGGSGGIAVINLKRNQYIGRLTGVKSNVRHLIIKNGSLFASINSSGYVQRIPLETLLAGCKTLEDEDIKIYNINDWISCKVPSGARTIEITRDGEYIFTSCNFGSCLAIVDASSMKLIGSIPADPYPVGLDISSDGRYIITTSQGRNDYGGNAVDIFKVDYL